MPAYSMTNSRCAVLAGAGVLCCLLVSCSSGESHRERDDRSRSLPQWQAFACDDGDCSGISQGEGDGSGEGGAGAGGGATAWWLLSTLSSSEAGHGIFSGSLRFAAQCVSGELSDYLLTVPARSDARIVPGQTRINWWLDRDLPTERTGSWANITHKTSRHDDLLFGKPAIALSDLMSAERLSVELSFFPLGQTRQIVDFSMNGFAQAAGRCSGSGSGAGAGS